MAALTYQDVAQAIAALSAAGKRVTNEAIYKAVGSRGSMSTIQKYRMRFSDELAKGLRSSFPASVPEELIPQFAGIWAAALEVASKMNEGQAEAVAEKMGAANEQAENIKQQLKNATRKNQELEAHLQKAEIHRAGLVAEIERLKGIALAAESDVQAAKHEAEQERIKAKSEAEKVDVVQAQAEKEAIRLMGLIDAARDEGRAEREKLRDATELFKSSKRRLESELHIANEKATQSVIVANNLRDEVARLKAEIDDLKNGRAE